MAVWRTRVIQLVSGSSARAESPTSRIGPITLGQKQAGKPSAGKPPAGFDAAGVGNRPTVRLVRHSQRKRGATDRLNLRGNRRQAATRLSGGRWLTRKFATSDATGTEVSVHIVQPFPDRLPCQIAREHRSRPL